MIASAVPNYSSRYGYRGYVKSQNGEAGLPGGAAEWPVFPANRPWRPTAGWAAKAAVRKLKKREWPNLRYARKVRRGQRVRVDVDVPTSRVPVDP